MTTALRGTIASTVTTRADSFGVKKTYGKRKKLKESAAYTTEYTDAAVQSYKHWRANCEADAQQSDSETESAIAGVDDDDAWTDAWADSVLQVLNSA